MYLIIPIEYLAYLIFVQRYTTCDFRIIAFANDYRYIFYCSMKSKIVSTKSSVNWFELPSYNGVFTLPFRYLLSN